MENTFWDKHYQKFAVNEPSNFAKYCLAKYLKKDDLVIELGCGNGRDGLALGSYAEKYIGYDACPIATKAFSTSLANLSAKESEKITVEQGDFTTLDFDALAGDAKRLVIYSRFSLHSIGYKDASRLFDSLAKIKSVQWTLLLEVRTIYDTLYGEGEKVGLHEFKTDHYRRFIDPQVFLSEMSNRFAIKYLEISSGFAPFKDQDPLVMRSAIQPLGMYD